MLGMRQVGLRPHRSSGGRPLALFQQRATRLSSLNQGLHQYSRLHPGALQQPGFFFHAARSRSALVRASTPAADAGPGVQPEASPSQSIWKSFWTFTGILAMLGSVGGALAALLGYFSTSYALALPLILPVVSLIASLQREGLISEVARQQYDSLSNTLRRDSVALLAEVRANVQEVKAALKVQTGSASRLSNVEARLSSLEGSLLSTGRTLREASSTIASLPDKINANQRAQMEALLTAIRQDLRRAADMRTNEESAGLAAVSSRLAAIDGSLAGLEVSQGELVRRLSLSMNSALVDAEGALQAAVRAEIERSMDPVRRLPTMLAAALPNILAASQPLPAPAPMQDVQYDGSGYDGMAGASSAGAGQGNGSVGVQLSAAALETLRGLMRQEAQVALQTALEYQRQNQEAAANSAAVAPSPTTMRLEAEQWDALGKRLTRLETVVDGVPQATTGLLLTQLPAQLGPPLDETARSAAAGVVAAVTAEGERVGALLQSGFAAVQTDVTNLASAMQPISASLQDGFTVNEGKQEQLQHQLTVVVQGLGSVEEKLSSVDKALQQSLDTMTAAASVVPTQAAGGGSEGPAAGAVAAAELEQLRQAVSGLQQLSGSVSTLQTTVQSLTECAATVQSLLARSQAAQKEIEAAAAKQQSLLQQQQQALLQQQAQLQAPAPAGRLPAAALLVDDAGTAQQTPPVTGGIPEGLLSREDDDTSSTSSTQAPAAHQFPEGMLSREESPAPTDTLTYSGGAASGASAGVPQAPPAHSFAEGLLSREEDAGITGSIPQAPPARQFPDGMLSREESPAPASYSASNSSSSSQQQSFPEGMLSREDEAQQAAAAATARRAADSATAATDRVVRTGEERFSEGLLSREDAPTTTSAGGYSQAEASGRADQYAREPRTEPSVSPVGDLRGLSEQEVVFEGLRLLRAGREETQKGQDWAQADSYLRDAYRVFQYALEASPNDTRALGNCGNVLLAQGELKQLYLAALTASPPPTNEREAAVQSQAEASLRTEALSLLTRAGEMFKSVLELEGWSSRALVNWGRAMCLRAELSAGQNDVVQKLYRAALDKFEAVLEEEPGMIAARYRSALAMLELSRTYPPGSRETINLLLDSKNYLTDLISDAASQPEAAALQASCGVALQQCQQELARAKSLRQ